MERAELRKYCGGEELLCKMTAVQELVYLMLISVQTVDLKKKLLHCEKICI